jgi:DNA-binding transcriptional ArsR family regulator
VTMAFAHSIHLLASARRGARFTACLLSTHRINRIVKRLRKYLSAWPGSAHNGAMDPIQTPDADDDAPAAAEDDEPPSPQLLREAAETFGMLAATTRLHIVWLLARSEQDVTALAEQTGGTVAAVSQHLAKLKLAGLVSSRREGRRQVYVVDDPHVVAVVRQMIDHHAELLPESRRPA